MPIQKLADASPIERLGALAALIGDRAYGQALARLAPLDNTEMEVPIGLSLPCSESSLLRILQALHVVDKGFETILGYFGHVYILGDNTLFEVFESLLGTTPHAASNRDLLGSLATIGLIYRFNAALKFGYPSRGVMQLRLNGWGRDAVETLNSQQDPIYPKLTKRCATVLRASVKEYQELLALCSSTIRPLNIARIAVLNSTLALKIVT